MAFNEHGRTEEGIYAAQGNIEMLDSTLEEHGAHFAEHTDIYQETPLHLAATYGHFEVIKFLVRQYEVKVDPTNWEGWTPLFCALSRGHIQAADFLRRQGANMEHATPTGLTAMHIAAYYNQSEAIEYLIQQVPQLLRRETKFGATPLALARPGPNKRMLFNAAEELH